MGGRLASSGDRAASLRPQPASRSSLSGIPDADERWLRCTVEFLRLQGACGFQEMGYEAEFFHPRWTEFLDPSAQRKAILAWQRDKRNWYAPAPNPSDSTP